MRRANHPDTAGVVVHPPLLFAAGVTAAAVLERWCPLPFELPAAGRWLGLLLLPVPLAIGVWGAWTLRRSATAVRPTRPTTAIVTGGPFRYSRNPLYLSLTLLYVAILLIFRLEWAPLVLVPVLTVLHFGIIRREERYLERKFGAEYDAYRARVRRWI